MHPTIEGPGLAMQRPLQHLARALIDSGEAAWYNAAFSPDRVPVVATVAVGAEAIALDRFIQSRRKTAGLEAPMVYARDGLLAHLQRQATPADLQDILDFLGQLRANLDHAGDEVVHAPGLTAAQKLEVLTSAQALDVSLGMVEDYVNAVSRGDRAKIAMYQQSARAAPSQSPKDTQENHP